MLYIYLGIEPVTSLVPRVLSYTAELPISSTPQLINCNYPGASGFALLMRATRHPPFDGLAPVPGDFRRGKIYYEGTVANSHFLKKKTDQYEKCGYKCLPSSNIFFVFYLFK